MNILVTGGSGFIGSNFINYLLNEIGKEEEIFVINLDKLTYAGAGKNLEHLGVSKNPNYSFVYGDVGDAAIVNYVFETYSPEIVFNFAAESHVDRSISDAKAFERSNVGGVVTLLEAAKNFALRCFVQVSTDEVYGSAKDISFSEDSKLNPSSPYSSSKAAADLIALSYFRTHKIPVVITRSANNYGPYQFPEKMLPLFITNLLDGKKVPLMWSEENPGLNIRDWLHVRDNCRAIWFAASKGKPGEIYNIPGHNEKQNIWMTKRLLEFFNLGEDMIEKIPHRKGHDFKYSIVGEKLKSLGFEYEHSNLSREISHLIGWYKANESWWRPIKK